MFASGKKKRSSGKPKGKSGLQKFFKSLSDRWRKTSRGVGRNFNSSTDAVEKRFKNVSSSVGDLFKMIGSILVPQAIRKKFDFGKSKKVNQLGKQVGELTEKVEKQFTSSASGFAEVFKFIFAIFVPKFIRDWFSSTSKALSKGTARLYKRLSKKISRLARRFLPAWLFRILKRFSTRWKLLNRNVGRFISAWWSSRDFNKLALSTPAILLLIPILGCVALSMVNNNGDKIMHYRRAASKADDEERYSDAILFRQKLRQLGYLRIENAEYESGLALVANGDYEGAYERILNLAPLVPLDSIQPDDDPETEVDESAVGGLLEAHIWIAAALMREKISIGTEDENWQRIREHAEVADKIEKVHFGRTQTLGKYFLIKADRRDGVDMNKLFDDMIALASDRPEFAYDLMLHSANSTERGLRNNAIRHARTYLRYAEKIAYPSASQYVAIYQARTLLGQRDKAEETALEGISKYRDDEDLRRVGLSLLHRKWIRMARTSPEQLPTMQQLMEAILASDITEDSRLTAMYNEVCQQFVIKWVRDKERVEKFVDELRQADRVHPTLMLLAGDKFAGITDWPQALSLYEEAVELDVDNAQAHNNVAWIQSNIDPLQIETALEHSNRAIELRVHSTFLETRGQIFAKLERWEESAKDLERALNGTLSGPDLRNAHATLVKVYQALGQMERADAHRALSGT